MDRFDRSGDGGRLPLQVVVDTSLLRQTGGDLTKGDWPSFLAAARLGLLTLRLPKAALQELVDHRERDLKRLSKLERDAAKLREQLMASSNRAVEPPNLDADQIRRFSSAYREEVIDWFAEAGSILDDPRVTHTELVKRVLAKRRPFNESERGYRDALIWYSTMECAASGETILLTANTKDFASRMEDGVLAEDLQADLKDRLLNHDRVTLATSTSAVLQQVLPEWGVPEVQSAWVSFVSSNALLKALDHLLDVRLGHELTSPPEVSQYLWGLGIRSVDAITGVEDVRLVDDGDGWYRIHCRISGSGLVGGYAWSWGDPDGNLEDFTLWDDWGGLTQYYTNATSRPVDIVIAARFRRLVELADIDVIEASLPSHPPRSGDERRRMRRTLQALALTLLLHLDNDAFIVDVLSEHLDEFSSIVGGILSEWEDLADSVPGHYPALVRDNLPTVLEEAAGLRALLRDLQGAVAALESLEVPPNM